MAELRSGYDYQIPGQFINMQQPAVGPIAPTEGGMATDAVDPRNPLANRGKLTSDYFNNYAALDAYAKEMNKQGINIFAPDYTAEGGGMPFQIGLQLQASVLHAANKLQNEFAAEQQLRPLIAKGDVRRRSDVDPNSLWAQDPNSVYGTQPMASIQEANLRNRENLYTQGDSNRRNEETSQVLSRIDQAVAQGIMSPEEGELQKSYYIKNTPQVNPYTLRPTSTDQKEALKQQAIQQRAQLIRQLKAGILTNDEGVLNILKRVPGVNDAEYVNTGDRVGITVYGDDQTPSFIDLTKGGANDLNALLSRIEGQYNIANEDLIPFDTSIELPPSNASTVLEPFVQSVVSGGSRGDNTNGEIIKLNQIAQKLGNIVTPDNEVIRNLSVKTNLLGTPKLVLEVSKVDGSGKVGTSKLSRTIDLEDNPDYLERIIELNKNSIAKELGAGFQTSDSIDW